jgi:hydroxymethylbilane synthase
VAIPERGATAELLLAKPRTLQPTAAAPLGLPAGAVLGTSSLRRAAQALALEPGVMLEALRGNVPTRVRKLREGRYDAILLAAAGVERLGIALDGLDHVRLPPEVMLPAPGQGALAVEARAGDPSTDCLLALHDPGVAACVAAERGLLALLGGGCHLPLGCLAEPVEGGLRLQAALGAVDEALTRAEVARVGAVAQDAAGVVRLCFEALREVGATDVGT